MGNPPVPPPPPNPEETGAREPFRVNLFKGRTAALPPSLAALSERLEKPRGPAKERAAWQIGTILIVTFAGAFLFVTWEGFRVVFFSMDHPDRTKILINEAVIPFLEKVGTFLTTVFGPLLAFILGYYFGQKTESADSNKTS